MRKAGLEEAQAGIKTAGININNLRYADDTTLMGESEEELKSLLMKVKEDTTTIHHSVGSFGHSNQSRKRSKRNPDRKRISETLPVCR